MPDPQVSSKSFAHKIDQILRYAALANALDPIKRIKCTELLYVTDYNDLTSFYALKAHINRNMISDIRQNSAKPIAVNYHGQMFIICRLGKQRGSSIIAKIQALKFNKVRHMLEYLENRSHQRNSDLGSELSASKTFGKDVIDVAKLYKVLKSRDRTSEVNDSIGFYGNKLIWNSNSLISRAFQNTIIKPGGPSPILGSIRHCYLVQWGYSRGILRDVVTLRRCARRCRFHMEGQSEANMYANTSNSTYLVSERPFRDPPWQSALHPSSEIPTSLWSRISLS
ncbi:hypothetical protein EAG_11368 [Camponotus floridanus]|uniref:Uncharacterized protein n=1 Tax=Camponotus floridanus TaxID=104421 RepID=E1ZZ38_CAMFO|nr:hypothetical protein EAG_11368 [Camponotus floridanus]